MKKDAKKKSRNQGLRACYSEGAKLKGLKCKIKQREEHKYADISTADASKIVEESFDQRKEIYMKKEVKRESIKTNGIKSRRESIALMSLKLVEKQSQKVHKKEDLALVKKPLPGISVRDRLMPNQLNKNLAAKCVFDK